MNQIERRDKGMAYVCDDEAFAQQAECRKILQQLNFMDRSDFDGIKEVVKQLFGKIRRFTAITALILKSARSFSQTITALLLMLQR